MRYVNADQMASVVSKEYDESEAKEAGTYAGLCVASQKTIYISHHSAGDATLLHEVLHAIEGMLGLELHEIQVRCLETAIYQVLRGNEGLIHRMFG